MKKLKLIFLISLISTVSIVQTSCIGSFTLTRNVYEFNTSLGDPFVEEIVFLAFVVVPVYGIATFADAVIFNLIEFWTGDNPLAQNNSNTDVIIDQTANSYQFKNIKNGKSLKIEYDESTNSSYAITSNNKIKLVEYVPESSSAKVYMPNGEIKNVKLSGQSLLSFKNEFTHEFLFARN